MSENDISAPRLRNYSWEALAEVTNSDWDAARGELSIALKSIKQQSDVEDDYLLADEIHERARMYRSVMGDDVLLTPTALAKHWKRVAEESQRKRRPQGTNLTAEPSLPLPKKQEVPEWVRVWYWARRVRAPRNFIPFPQQEAYSDPTKTMPPAEYEMLRAEWLEAGSPGFDLKTLAGEVLKRDHATEVHALLSEINT